jgi:hypothetical protein
LLDFFGRLGIGTVGSIPSACCCCLTLYLHQNQKLLSRYLQHWLQRSPPCIDEPIANLVKSQPTLQWQGIFLVLLQAIKFVKVSQYLLGMDETGDQTTISWVYLLLPLGGSLSCFCGTRKFVLNSHLFQIHQRIRNVMYQISFWRGPLLFWVLCLLKGKTGRSLLGNIRHWLRRHSPGFLMINQSEILASTYKSF